MQDVTGRRLAEERLREAEERYRTMVEQLPLVTYVDALDDDSSAIYMSPQVEPLLGYPVEEWLSDSKLFPKLLHPDDRDRVMEEVVRCNETGDAVREGVPADRPRRPRRLDSRPGPASARGRRFAAADAGPDDRHHRAKAERAALREAEERYRQLVERLPAISYIASGGAIGDWLFVSPQIESTIGFTAGGVDRQLRSLWCEPAPPRGSRVRDRRRAACARERRAAGDRVPDARPRRRACTGSATRRS